MRDGSRETSHGGQFFALQERILRTFALRYIHAKNQNAGNFVVGFTHWLVHEIQVSLLQWLSGNSRNADATAVRHERLTSLINLVKNIDETLLRSFGQCLTQRLAQHVAIPD